MPPAHVIEAVSAIASRVAASRGLEVFDVQGRRVRTLVRGQMAPGPHRVVWNGQSDSGARLAGGVYLYRLTQGPRVAHQKLILLR